MSVTANMRPSTTPTICAVRLSLIRRYYPARLEPGGSRDHTFALLVKHSGYRPRLPDIRAQDRCERRAGAQILRGTPRRLVDTLIRVRARKRCAAVAVAARVCCGLTGTRKFYA